MTDNEEIGYLAMLFFRGLAWVQCALLVLAVPFGVLMLAGWAYAMWRELLGYAP